jgi:chromosome segregation ATPase
MEVRLDKQDKEIIKLQQQVESLIEKVTQLEERNRAKDAHILTLTERIKYLVKLLKDLLVQLKNAGIMPKIHLPSWIDEYQDCEDEK